MSQILQGSWGKCFPLPTNTYQAATQLCLLLKWHSFMTQHSIPLTKCKAELTAQYAFKTYDTYAFMANLGNLGSWQSVYTQL